MDKRRRAVLLGGEAENGKLRALLAKYVTVTRARDIPEVLGILQGNHCDVLFCDWSFGRPGACACTWREALKEIQKYYPELPTIIVHHAADEDEWAEVLSAGAFDLLAPPYSDHLLLAILEHAVASREGRAVALAG